MKIYVVTTTSCRLAYTVQFKEWEGKQIVGVAASEALPGRILVICDSLPYVYEQELTKGMAQN